MTSPRKPQTTTHSASEAEWAEAVRREAVLRPLSTQAGLADLEVKAAAHKLSISRASVYKLLRVFRRNPVTASLLPRKPGPAKGTRLLDAAIETQTTSSIEAVYLKRERPTLKGVLRQLRADCRTAGLAAPSMNALRARVSARSLRERVKAREGAAAADNQFRQVRPGLQTERPLQVVQIDHTPLDLMLVDDATRACIGRPWLTLALDVRTRMVLGLLLSLEPPCATSAALVVAQAVLPKQDWLTDRATDLAWPVQGLPEIIHVDNGREFHSRAFERGCQQHGIRIDYRPPATPRFGGHIERLMGTLMGRMHALLGSTSSNVAARGDYDAEAQAVLTFREFERILVLEVLGPYHNEVHSALGRTPAAAWAEGTTGLPVREPADAAALQITPVLAALVAELQRDLHSALLGAAPGRPWGPVRSGALLLQMVRDLVLITVLAKGMQFEQRTEMVIDTGKTPYMTMLYEPVTPAALPPYAAFGMLAITGAMLDSLGRDWSASHTWRPGRDLMAINAPSFVEWLGADGRRWLREASRHWNHPVSAAFGTDQTAAKCAIPKA